MLGNKSEDSVDRKESYILPKGEIEWDQGDEIGNIGLTNPTTILIKQISNKYTVTAWGITIILEKSIMEYSL